jgi:nitrite reductase (NADH) large subunit
MVLAGEKSADDIVLNDIDWYRRNGIRTRLGVRIESIDREKRLVVDAEDIRLRSTN